jgi:hypothetical protein
MKRKGTVTASVTCAFCCYTYVPDLAEDRRSHKTRHRGWVEVMRAGHHRPMPYAAREALKQIAYTLQEEDGELVLRVAGVEMLLRAHFDRSLEAVIGGAAQKYHPTFGRYVLMRLEGDPAEFPQDVAEALRKIYEEVNPPPAPGRVSAKSSYWER